MKIIYKLLLWSTILILNGCSHDWASLIPWKQTAPANVCTTKPIGKPCPPKTYAEFKQRTNLRKSYKVFKDKELLAQSSPENTHLKVDVSEQRVKLFVDNKVALSSPCTTGAKHKFEPNTKIYRDKHTPLGEYKILEKIKDKRSSIFGKYYRGKRCVYKGDKRKYRGSKKGVRYEGASLKNWMRLTGGGIGLHASKYVKRYPGTNGCIRLPYSVSKTIFKHVKKGTKVSVVH